MDKRIILMLLKLNVKIPFYIHKINVLYKNKEKLTEKEIKDNLFPIMQDVLKASNINLKYSGIENLPKEQGYVLFANHQNIYDPVILFLAHIKQLSFIPKIELKKVELLRKIAELTKSEFIDRCDAKSSLRLISDLNKEIKENKRNYIIFPEGTRSLDGTMLDFKAGSFKLGTKVNAPIIPVTISSTYLLKDTIKKQNVFIFFLEPIYYEEYKNMNTKELSEEVKKRIKKMDDFIVKPKRRK